MKVVLFTQNGSLNNLWRSYWFDDSVKFAHNKTFFVSILDDTVDIAGVDIDSIKGDVGGFIGEILQKLPNLKILILANEPKFSEGKSLLTIGIKGYANSHMQKIHFDDALETIRGGNVWLYPEFIQEMIGELTTSYAKNDAKKDGLDKLSGREKEIAQLIYKGLTNIEISQATNITLRTVKAHTTAIYNKLSVKDRIGLVLLMQQRDV
ncbi:MAG: response regulator transcription factor [Campylobacter sp.]|nr:response regulator transcription factor [Campylobacter sp.]